eukprot:GFKZ01012371.1.p1 GENE.GFKZ01012371.1~~GFKZ01012371.1.p1  ORF type:complete len:281 (-),score=33.45 GFKZ01012371.1:275-1117(-)
MALPTPITPTPTVDWIEIFHSKPSMKNMYLQEKLPDGTFTPPTPSSRLVDASHIRPAFRVYRTPARPIEFMLTNGTDRNWEDNHGANYHVSTPGRYVVEHGIRRVDDANTLECIQAVLRTADQWIQLEFRADLWEKCFCSYQKDGQPWTAAPGVEMTFVEKPNVEGKYFQIAIKAQTLHCAFNDGGEIWDSNMRNNYIIGHPGKYDIKDGAVIYVQPADNDSDEPLGSLPLTPADAHAKSDTHSTTLPLSSTAAAVAPATSTTAPAPKPEPSVKLPQLAQ